MPRLRGRYYYVGRDMKTSHKGLGITETEWDVFMPHVAAALDSVGASPREKAEFMNITEGLKWDIVEASHSATK